MRFLCTISERYFMRFLSTFRIPSKVLSALLRMISGDFCALLRMISRDFCALLGFIE